MSARAAFSDRADAHAALEEAWATSGAALERSPDLVALFCAAEHSEAAHDLADALADLAPDAAVIGACAADGVIAKQVAQQKAAPPRGGRDAAMEPGQEHAQAARATRGL